MRRSDPDGVWLCTSPTGWGSVISVGGVGDEHSFCWEVSPYTGVGVAGKKVYSSGLNWKIHGSVPRAKLKPLGGGGCQMNLWALVHFFLATDLTARVF